MPWGNNVKRLQFHHSSELCHRLFNAGCISNGGIAETDRRARQSYRATLGATERLETIPSYHWSTVHLVVQWGRRRSRLGFKNWVWKYCDEGENIQSIFPRVVGHLNVVRGWTYTSLPYPFDIPLPYPPSMPFPLSTAKSSPPEWLVKMFSHLFFGFYIVLPYIVILCYLKLRITYNCV